MEWGFIPSIIATQHSIPQPCITQHCISHTHARSVSPAWRPEQGSVAKEGSRSGLEPQQQGQRRELGSGGGDSAAILGAEERGVMGLLRSPRVNSGPGSRHHGALAQSTSAQWQPWRSAPVFPEIQCFPWRWLVIAKEMWHAR